MPDAQTTPAVPPAPHAGVRRSAALIVAHCRHPGHAGGCPDVTCQQARAMLDALDALDGAEASAALWLEGVRARDARIADLEGWLEAERQARAEAERQLAETARSADILTARAIEAERQRDMERAMRAETRRLAEMEAEQWQADRARLARDLDTARRQAAELGRMHQWALDCLADALGAPHGPYVAPLVHQVVELREREAAERQRDEAVRVERLAIQERDEAREEAQRHDAWRRTQEAELVERRDDVERLTLALREAEGAVRVAHEYLDDCPAGVPRVPEGEPTLRGRIHWLAEQWGCAAADAARLAAALTAYGQHRNRCALFPAPSGKPCDCGLADALAARPPRTPPPDTPPAIDAETFMRDGWCAGGGGGDS